MGYFRFHRSKQVLPGVRLNFNKSGGSVSLGVTGARVNISPNGVRSTLGVPGSGVSYISQSSFNAKPRKVRRTMSATTQAAQAAAQESALRGVFDISPKAGKHIVKSMLRQNDVQALLATRAIFVEGCAKLPPDIAQEWMDMYDDAIEQKVSNQRWANGFWGVIKFAIGLCLLGVLGIVLVVAAVFIAAMVHTF